MARTAIHASADPFFSGRAPWWVASVHCDCGAVIIAHLLDGQIPIGQAVLLRIADVNGRSGFVATAQSSATPAT